MDTLDSLHDETMKLCEKHGFLFQTVFGNILQMIVTRRRPHCNREQLTFWMANADIRQRREAIDEALAIIRVTHPAESAKEGE